MIATTRFSGGNLGRSGFFMPGRKVKAMLDPLRKSLCLRVAVIIAVFLLCVNDLSFAADPSPDALAPPLSTKPPCTIIRNEDNTWDIVTDLEAIKALDRGLYSAPMDQLAGPGVSFTNRWAFVDLCYLFKQALEKGMTKVELVPLIEKHFRRRDGICELILEGYDIYGIKEVRSLEDRTISGFLLPVKRRIQRGWLLEFTLNDRPEMFHGGLPGLDIAVKYYNITPETNDPADEDGYIISSMAPEPEDQPSCPDNGMMVTDSYKLGELTSGDRILSDEEILSIVTEKARELKALHPEVSGRVDFALARIKYQLDTGEHISTALAARIVAAAVSNRRKREEGRYTLHYARDCMFTYCAQEVFARLEGRDPDEEAGVLYLNRKMMGRVYHKLSSLSEPFFYELKKGEVVRPTKDRREFFDGLEKWFEDEMAKGPETPFARFAEGVYRSLSDSGYFKKEKITLLDTGSRGTPLLFIWALTRYFDRHRHGLSGPRDIELLLINSSTWLIPGYGLKDLSAEDLELFGRYGLAFAFEDENFLKSELTDDQKRRFIEDSGTLWLWETRKIRDKAELIGSSRGHPVRYEINTTTNRSRISIEDAGSRLLFFYLALLTRNMAVAHQLGELGPENMKHKLRSIIPPYYTQQAPAREAVKTSRSLDAMKEESLPHGDERFEGIPEKEKKHSRRLADTTEKLADTGSSEPLVVLLGTSWIKGYEKGRHLQYDALNPLISSLRRFYKDKGMIFRDGSDSELAGMISSVKTDMPDARIVVLAGGNTVTSKQFNPFRQDEKIFLAGVDNKFMTVDNYVRLVEMLDLAMRLAFRDEFPVDLNNPNIYIENRGNCYIFIPKAEPMDYKLFKRIYELQIYA